MKYLESQRAVVGAVMADMGTGTGNSVIRALVDEVGLPASSFGNEHFKYAYSAAMEAWFESLKGGPEATIKDVFSKLEDIYRSNGHAKTASKLMQQWRDRVAVFEVDGDPVGVAVANARLLIGAETKAVVKTELKGFEKRLHSARGDEIYQVIGDFEHFLGGATRVDGRRSTKLSATIASSGSMGRPETTGYARLDGIRNRGPLAIKGEPYGGWKAGHLNTMVGLPGSGKTTVALNLAGRRAELGMPVIYHSFEMDTEALYKTLVSCVGRVPIEMAFTPLEEVENPIARHALRDARATIEEWVRIYDEPATMQDLVKRYRRHQLEFNGRMVLHIVDHLWAFLSTGDQPWHQMQALGKGWKAASKAYNACTLLLSHPNSSFEGEWNMHNRVTECYPYGGRGLVQWSDTMIAIGRHTGSENGQPLPGFESATAFQMFKNRFAQDSGNGYFVMDFDPRFELLTDVILHDDQRTYFSPDAPEPVTEPMAF